MNEVFLFYEILDKQTTYFDNNQTGFDFICLIGVNILSKNFQSIF